MDKTLLKKAAIQSVALMLAVVTISYAMHQYQTVTIAASNMIDTSEEYGVKEVSVQDGYSTEPSDIESNSNDVPVNSNQGLSSALINLDNIKMTVDESILKKLGNNYLVIEKPQGNNISYQLEDLYIKSSIRLTLKGLPKEEVMDSLMVGRVRDDKLFTGDPHYTQTKSYEKDSEGKKKVVITKDFGNDLVHGITITSSTDVTSEQNINELVIELDSVYVQTIYEDDNYFFIDLRKPKDVYDKVLVVDAGHGGKDAGALSRDEKHFEKNVNLQILLELKKLLDKEDIKVYYTRTGDDTVFLRPRVTLANAVNCDFFISIHCNASELNSPNGTEALYYNTKFKDVKSFDLAKIMVEEVGKTIPLRQRGLVEENGDDIFILENAVVPATLIEVGYVTNNSDMNFLNQEVNQQAAAQGIYNGILRAYSELGYQRGQ